MTSNNNEMRYLVGFDIGGTNCAVTIAPYSTETIKIIDKIMFPTDPDPKISFGMLTDALDTLLQRHRIQNISSIGISCGSPLDSKKGIIMAPPNLPRWINFDIVSPLEEKYGVPAKLQNDANACALAEWKYGAGKGYDNVIFLTNGTGMGAGLILDGRLYTGKNDFAGEVGHMRMDTHGPLGYGKHGSYEGFCSGSGIAKYSQMLVTEAIYAGHPPAFCSTLAQVPALTAKSVGLAAQAGDPFAQEIYYRVGLRMGQGIAVLIDILNPEVIIIGSIYTRQTELLAPPIQEVIRRECLPIPREHCKILPAMLGENIGDYAALTIAATIETIDEE